MANVKISQLPSWTGTAADLRWFVMNNSGETETYKYSGYTSGLINGTGVDSIISAPWLSPTYGAAQSNGLGSTAIGTKAQANAGQSSAYGWNCKANNDVATALGVSATASGLASIAIGYSVTASNSYSIGLGAENESSGNQSISIGRFAAAQNTNTISIGSNTTAETEGSNCFGSVMLIRNSTFSNTIGGNNNVIITSPGTTNNSIFGGLNNRIDETSSNSSVVGGQYNKSSSSGYGFIGGGLYNILSGGTNYSSIIGGLSNENYGNYSGIFNGTLNKINNPATEHASIIGAYSSSTEGDYTHIIGGLYNQIFNQQAVILGGQYNIIAAGSSQAEIIGSRNCIITGTTTDNTIINSIDSVIPNGVDRAVMLGTSGRTANADDTTYVENLRAYKNINSGTNNVIALPGVDNSIIGGSNNTLGANTTQSTITAGFNNTVQATILGMIGGTQDNTVTSAGYTYVLVGGGYNTVNATNASAGNAMYSSYFCTDNTINDGSVIGSSNNWFSGSRNGSMGGYGKHNHISNSYASTITNNGSSDVGEWFNKIDSSSASTITTSKKSQIIGGEGNAITNKENVVMLGCNNRTAPRSNATMVENLVVFNYAGLNFADDTAAAAGGVVLGQVYHTGGVLKIRIV